MHMQYMPYAGHGRLTARELSRLSRRHRDVHASVVIHPSLDSGASRHASSPRSACRQPPLTWKRRLVLIISSATLAGGVASAWFATDIDCTKNSPGRPCNPVAILCKRLPAVPRGVADDGARRVDVPGLPGGHLL